MTESQQHNFLWLDLETTGLAPHDGEIAEWALVFADDGPGGTFEPVEAYGSVLYVSQDVWDRADSWIHKTHGGSGLIAECLDPNATKLADAEDFLRSLLADKAPRGMFTIAGNSPHFDLAWLRVHMPKLATRLSHRVFDVSTLRRALQEYHDPVADSCLASVIGEPAHRAMADVHYSLAMARAVLGSTGWARRPVAVAP